MSRGDEIEPGDPEKKRRPAFSNEDEPDEPGDDRLQLGKRSRSGAVTAVGIIGIILGCFALLSAVCTSVTPAVMPALMDMAAKANPNDPKIAQAKEAMARVPTWYVMGSAAFGLLLGLGLLIAGVGVLKRVAFARPVMLILAGLGVVSFLLSLVGTFSFGTMDTTDPTSVAGGVCGLGCSAFGNLGFAVMAFVVLLNARNAAEFRK
jgi:hypothetical protein